MSDGGSLGQLLVYLQRRRHFRNHSNGRQSLRLHFHCLGRGRRQRNDFSCTDCVYSRPRRPQRRVAPVALGVTSYHLMVRNRWGEIVWSTGDPTEPWLGQSSGGSHYAPNGIYPWKVTYRDQLGYPEVKQGTVSLVR